MAQLALKTARTLLAVAGKPGSTSQDRRSFVSHLVTLPAYRNPECTLLFSTLVTKFFAEFEDLQDRAVDAVLDLCEDEEEQTRIIGIKGLGSTARADPRWVRGNAGVLLQLLECRALTSVSPGTSYCKADNQAERELREVKTVLSALLSQSPLEVFAVMADDCKGSEDETGASRRNILEYLYKDCAEIRQAILESGKNLAAEAVFRAGFTDVLKTTAVAESRMVLEMLLPLTSISGRNAKPETTDTFARALADSLKSDSSTSVTTRHIQLFADLVRRAPKVDPQVALYFFGRHGGAVVESIMVKKDEVALGLIKKMPGWVDMAVMSWKTEGKEGKEGAGEKVVKDCVMAMMEELLDCVKDVSVKQFPDTASRIELLLLPLYSLIRYRDRRKELSDRKVDDLIDLGENAQKASKSYSRRTEEGRCIRNIRDMAEILSDRTSDFSDITPSWLPAPRSPSPPSRPASKSVLPPARPSVSAAPSSSSSKSIAPPSSGVRLPSGPRAASHGAGPATALPARTTNSAGPSRTLDKMASTGPRQPSPTRSHAPPAGPASRQPSQDTPPHQPTASGSTAASKLEINAASTSRTVPTDRPPAGPRMNGTPVSTPVAPVAPAIPAEPTTHRSNTVDVPKANTSQSAIPSAPAGPSIKGRATAGALISNPAGTDDPPRSVQAGASVARLPSTSGKAIASSSRGHELISNSSQIAAPTPVAAPKSSQPASGSESLNGVQPAGRSISIKRQREEAESGSGAIDAITPAVSAVTSTASPAAPSLLSRISGRGDSDLDSKRARPNAGSEVKTAAARLSLRDRLNGSASPSPGPAISLPSSTGLSILNRASPTPIVPPTAYPSPAPSSGLSIRRIGAIIPTAAVSPAPLNDSTSARPSLSVLGRSSSASNSKTAANLSINGRSSGGPSPTPPIKPLVASAANLEPEVDAGAIRRKGRGFERTDMDVDMDTSFTMPSPPISQPSTVSPFGLGQPQLPQFGLAVPGRGTVQPFRPPQTVTPPTPTDVAQNKGSLLSRIGGQ